MPATASPAPHPSPRHSAALSPAQVLLWVVALTCVLVLVAVVGLAAAQVA